MKEWKVGWVRLANVGKSIKFLLKNVIECEVWRDDRSFLHKQKIYQCDVFCVYWCINIFFVFVLRYSFTFTCWWKSINQRKSEGTCFHRCSVNKFRRCFVMQAMSCISNPLVQTQSNNEWMFIWLCFQYNYNECKA